MEFGVSFSFVNAILILSLVFYKKVFSFSMLWRFNLWIVKLSHGTTHSNRIFRSSSVLQKKNVYSSFFKIVFPCMEKKDSLKLFN
ncbi:Os01g0939800 [Oryza sativa Japonica Group]|uniref:Os01g0939800 protein n=2 Tax=Oryza sativa subsp. japonica TaxID=39947 RepID=Q0JG62_ORYSJ|nr:hypothetical protein EE612_007890 [Oryza sativa]BAF07266.1 Os01g0939800 [Oryza sativa Japonica Group]BAS76146.1 Os01g0939800 [Oryza sativa Japonica Group]|eukprot:NP_001045352.1 Os01g0939800 [Oryza sativa Japonica Group]